MELGVGYSSTCIVGVCERKVQHVLPSRRKVDMLVEFGKESLEVCVTSPAAIK